MVFSLLPFFSFVFNKIQNKIVIRFSSSYFLVFDFFLYFLDLVLDFVVGGGGDLWMLNSLGKMCFAKYAKEMDIGPWFQELNSLFRSVKCDGGCFDTYCTQNLFIGSIVLCFILYNKTDFSVFSCCHLSKEERENCATC